MFPEQLKKILKLIKQTGDRVVVFDPSAPDDSYVILDLDRYSSMVEVKEIIPVTTNNQIKEVVQEVVEKAAKEPVIEIDHVKEVLKNNIVEDKIEDIAKNPVFVKDSVKTENLTEDDLTDKINREISMWKNRDDSPFLAEENKPKKVWKISPQVKNHAQAVE